jgi:hypothetical protein
MNYFCCDDDRRRNAVAADAALNGIDFLEVVDDPSAPFETRQRTLFVHFLKPLAPGQLTETNIRIDGGERIQGIAVAALTGWALSSPPALSPWGGDPRVIAVHVSKAGDFSIYRLRLVKGPNDVNPPDGFDKVLSSVRFSFKVACPSDFDCATERVCPDEPPKAPRINYLAKDYASFRQLMLDRMATLAPAWTERNVADIGIALVELFAYVGDYLSYEQDAVATEAYIGTARRRTSLRRHARLIDYPMHDGRNARVWVQVKVTPGGDGLQLKKQFTSDARTTTKLLTRVPELGEAAVVAQPSSALAAALTADTRVFELKLLKDATLHHAHNEMKFYTWGAQRCCLPKGAMHATLDGAFPDLSPGDVLVFVENRGPETGSTADADPTRRHAVQLESRSVTTDPLGGAFRVPPVAGPVEVTEIAWARADALPFAFCVSSRVGTTHYDDVGIALGNIVLADHGTTVTDEPASPAADPEKVSTSLVPDTVPGSNPALSRSPSGGNRCQDRPAEQTPARYRPRLTRAPLTHTAPFEGAPSAAVTLSPAIADPLQLPRAAITLREPGTTDDWEPRRDLLGSKATDKHFVVETETDGTAYLRFGNDRAGMRPRADVKLFATYRIGNGTAGNIGAGAIRHLVTSDPAVTAGGTAATILAVNNPLPAAGGLEPESIEHARQHAPSAFRRLERAVTTADYEALAIRPDVAEACGLDVQRAAATLRWTGSWHTMFVTADRLGGEPVDASFETGLRTCLERFRMAGHDLEIDAPRYVPLELELTVCVKSGYFADRIRLALLEALGSGTLPDGRLALFHPDNFTFGQPVYLSAVYAAAQNVAGVDSLVVTKLQRRGADSTAAIDSGVLEVGRLEIVRLDNDPNFPERGVLTVNA